MPNGVLTFVILYLAIGMALALAAVFWGGIGPNSRFLGIAVLSATWPLWLALLILAFAAVIIVVKLDDGGWSIQKPIRRLNQHFRRAFDSTPNFPRVWDLMAFVFPPKFREEVYRPSIEEDKADYYRAMKAYRTKWPRRWIRGCFLLRTVVRVCQCLWVLGLDRLALSLSALVPAVMQTWWRSR